MHTAQRKSKKGFTLIELIIVTAIVSLAFIPLLITYRGTRTNQALLNSAESFANHTRSAHVFARESRETKNWGIKRLNQTQYAIFSVISGADENENVYTLENAITFNADFRILFNIGTGETDNSQTITLNARNGNSIEIEVLKTGVVDIGEI